MVFLSGLKSTFLLWFLLNTTCGKPIQQKVVPEDPTSHEIPIDSPKTIIVGANRTALYLPLLEGKKVGIVANQTTVIFGISEGEGAPTSHIHLVDSLLALKIDIKKVFAPEHGFRGEADAGEKVTDGFDQRSGLPLISLYGKNRKPTADQLKELDVVLFDIQDVGVRFYTYIATLQLVMEACAENRVPVIVLDRPNPNGHYVDGPTMEKEHMGFLGMAPIPLVYGMSIGEYARMINEEGWLAGHLKADLTVIPLENWSHQSEYALPIRPSPNLPNDTAINLYPSLGLFEGTNINAGRGTEFQFQRFGAPFLDPSFFDFSYTPVPNFGSKTPKHNGTTCYGKDLSNTPRLSEVRLQWLIDAYAHALDKNKVFNENGFTKHAGTAKLQQQIESGLSEAEIKLTWQDDLERFNKIRAKYLLYD
jgi:uncharacterized protein YbbC (DUF1343 family)